MATKLIVPRAAGEGGFGTATKPFGPSYFQRIYFKDTNTTGSVQVAIVTTTDATATTLYYRTLTAGQAIALRADVICATADGVTSGAWGKCCGARYPTAGSSVLIPTGSLTTVSAGQDRKTDTSLDVYYDISTNDIRLRVVGLAGTTINWSAIITYVFVG